MREAEAKAREAAARESAEPSSQPQQKPEQSKEPAKEMEIDFDIKNTGQTKTISGFDTRQVVATITVREKGKKLEDSGGLVMIVDTWLTKQVDLKEIADFERRYWEKLAGPMLAGVDPQQMQQMASAIAMYPGLKEAFARLSKEDFGGTAIQTTTSVDAVKSAEDVKKEAANASSGSTASKNEPPPTSIGGALGGFMRKRQQQQEEKAAASPNADPSRVNIMTMNNEVLKIAKDVTAADVAMPAGFKESK
jgi:hypothetical protein